MIPLPSPLSVYIGAAAFALGAISGYSVRDWRCEAAQASALRAAAEKKVIAENEVVKQSTAYEAARDQTAKVETRTIERLRLVYRDKDVPPVSCAADPDTVRLLQASLDYANASATGKSGS